MFETNVIDEYNHLLSFFPRHNMRKFSLLMGALGGAMAGYLLSNEKLRDELVKAKKPEDAAKVLGKHLQKDSTKIVKDVQNFVKSDDVQQNLKKAKQFANAKFKEAKSSVQDMMKKGEKQAKGMMKKTAKKASKAGFAEKNV